MKKLYNAIVGLLSGGESLAIATVFDKSGSAPRADGAKMAVRADGSIIGTIGGGRLEADVINRAREGITARKSLIERFNLTGSDASVSDMICGGSGEVLVDFIDAGDDNNRKIYAAAAEIVSRGGKGWLITMLGKSSETPGINREQCLVKPDRTMIGRLSCTPYLLEKLITGPAKISIHSEAFDKHRFLVEPLRPGGTVYLFGAGHVSQKIAPLSESVGFRTVVIDDRADYASRERFPEPTELRVIDSFKGLPELEIDGDSYLVIITRGHLYDKYVLERVLRSDAAYVGMIGSRRKRDLIYDEIISHGFGREELERVFAPIGTDIGAETPEELAISIVGELVKVRSEKNAPKKREKTQDSTTCCSIDVT